VRTSRATIVALLASVATASPEVATGSTTGGTRAPGPDLASGGVVAPDPAPVKSSAPKHDTGNRAAPPASTPAPSVPTLSQTRSAPATAAVAKHAPRITRSRRPRRHHRSVRSAAPVARPGPIARIVSLPAARLVTRATGSGGSDGRLLRAAVALFLVALAEGSLLLRVAGQLPREAR